MALGVTIWSIGAYGLAALIRRYLLMMNTNSFIFHVQAYISLSVLASFLLHNNQYRRTYSKQLYQPLQVPEAPP
jgi:hypothetical protein